MGSKIKLFSFRGFIKAIGVKLVSKFVSMAVGRNYSYGRQTSLTSLTMKSLIKIKISFPFKTFSAKKEQQEWHRLSGRLRLQFQSELWTFGGILLSRRKQVCTIIYFWMEIKRHCSIWNLLQSKQSWIFSYYVSRCSLLTDHLIGNYR